MRKRQSFNFILISNNAGAGDGAEGAREEDAAAAGMFSSSILCCINIMLYYVPLRIVLWI
jgi:hypothetical protein